MQSEQAGIIIFERAADGSEQPEAGKQPEVVVVVQVVVIVSTAGSLKNRKCNVNQPEADTGNTVVFLAFLDATFGHSANREIKR